MNEDTQHDIPGDVPDDGAPEPLALQGDRGDDSPAPYEPPGNAAAAPTQSDDLPATQAAAQPLGWDQRVSGALAAGWQHTACMLSNLRRRFFKRQLPDYAVLTLHGPLLERDPDTPWFYDLIPLYHPPLSLESIDRDLRRLAADPDIRGVVVLCKGAALSLPQAQSLAMSFDRFRALDARLHREAGLPAKQVIVHVEEMGAAVYVAACAADKITATPLTDWDVTGLLSAPLFFRSALAQLGLEFDVVRVAPWKTAADSFAFDGLTDAARDQLNWLLDSLYQSIVSAISAGRKLDETTVQRLVDTAPLTARTAQAQGLFDHVLYEDELPALLGSESAPALLKPVGEIRRLLYRRPRPQPMATIGVISLRGSIMPGENRSFPLPLPLLGDESIGSTTAQQIIRQARADESLDAVVLHVDSPGGSALASDLVWRELYLLNQEVPVVVYMGDVAASGGYYIASASRKIVAQRATLTGSIGVIVAKLVAADALAKLHVRQELVQRGAHANLYNETTRWEGDLRQVVEENMLTVYGEFKQRVAANRGLSTAAVDEVAGGRVWTGEQAQARGLIDRLGDFHTAVEEACAAAGLGSPASVQLVPLTAPGETLLAEPMKAATARLGLRSARRVGSLVDWLAGSELQRLLTQEQIWLLADDLPRWHL